MVTPHGIASRLSRANVGKPPGPADDGGEESEGRAVALHCEQVDEF